MNILEKVASKSIIDRDVLIECYCPHDYVKDFPRLCEKSQDLEPWEISCEECWNQEIEGVEG